MNKKQFTVAVLIATLGLCSVCSWTYLAYCKDYQTSLDWIKVLNCIPAAPIVKKYITTPRPTLEKPYEAEFSCGNWAFCLTQAASGAYGPERATQEAEAQITREAQD